MYIGNAGGHPNQLAPLQFGLDGRGHASQGLAIAAGLVDGPQRELPR
jgi:hypothetical protein